jgi:hypothetical protein
MSTEDQKIQGQERGAEVCLEIARSANAVAQHVFVRGMDFAFFRKPMLIKTLRTSLYVPSVFYNACEVLSNGLIRMIAILKHPRGPKTGKTQIAQTAGFRQPSCVQNCCPQWWLLDREICYNMRGVRRLA